MLPVVMLMVLSAVPSLAMPGLNAVNIGKPEAALYTDLLGAQLHAGGLQILSARDLTAVLGLERQKQLLGCDDSSCAAELAGALGTDGIVLGDVGKLGSSWALNVKVLSGAGAVLAQHSTQVANADALPEAIEVGARALLEQLAVALQHPELQPGELKRPLRALAAVPLVIGGAALLGGAACLVVTGVKYNDVQTAPTVSQATAAAQQGKTWQPIGYALVGVGVAGLVTGIVFLLAGPQKVTPTVTLVPGGGSLGFAGVLP